MFVEFNYLPSFDPKKNNYKNWMDVTGNKIQLLYFDNIFVESMLILHRHTVVSMPESLVTISDVYTNPKKFGNFFFLENARLFFTEKFQNITK